MSTTPTTPNPFSMPMGELATAAGITPASSAPASPTPAAAPAAPAPAPAAPAAPVAPAPVVPEPFSVQQDDTGITIQMSPDFGGEVFKGKDWAEVGPKIAKAKADANAYIKTLKAQPPAQPAAPTPAPEPVDPAVQATRDWMLDEFAKGLGLSGKDDLLANFGLMSQTTGQMATNIAVTEFHQMCPGYVDTPENSAALSSYFPDDFGRFPTAQELKQAYALAVIDGKIIPQTSAQAPAAPRPPVMPSATATSTTTGTGDPWTMPLDQLAQLAGITK